MYKDRFRVCVWLAVFAGLTLGGCTPTVDAACDNSSQCKSDEQCASGLCIKLSVLYPDGGPSSGSDGGVSDAGSASDGGSMNGLDGGLDAGAADGGTADGGAEDAGSLGGMDAGVHDGGSADAGTEDGGSKDGGSDGGTPDGGIVSGPPYHVEGAAFSNGTPMKSTNYQLVGTVGPFSGTAHSANHMLNSARATGAAAAR